MSSANTDPRAQSVRDPAAREPTAAIAPSPSASKPRFLRLDVLRGSAVLGVLLFHLSNLLSRGGRAFYPIDLQSNPLPDLDAWAWASYAFHLGESGVNLFLVISGYCIARSVQCRLSGVDWKAFWVRRAWRLLGPYYAALAFAIAVSVGLGQPLSRRGPLVAIADVMLHVSMLHFLHPRFYYSLLSPAWSLSLEVALYASLPLLLTLCRRTSTRTLFGSVLVIAIAYRTLIALATDPHERLGAYMLDLMPARWFEWTLGVYLAVSRSRGEALSPWLARATRSWTIPLWLLAGTAAEWSCAGLVVSDILFGLGYFGALRWAVEEAPAGRAEPDTASPWVRGLAAVGLMSYSVYLFHAPMIVLAESWLRPHLPRTAAGLFALGGGLAVAILGVGWSLFLVLERPFLAVPASILRSSKRAPD